MDVRRRRYERLELQLDAISDLFAMAQQAPSAERQAELLAVAARAVAACHDDCKQAAERRNGLALVRGGALAAAAVAVGEWLREVWGAHRPVTVGALVVAGVAAAALVIGVWRDDQSQPPGAVPSVTAPPGKSTGPSRPPAPSRSAPEESSNTDTFDVAPPSPAPSSEAQSVRAPASSEPSATVGGSDEPGWGLPVEPSPSPSIPGAGVSPSVPPGSGGPGPCVVQVDVPRVHVDVARLLCL